MNRFSAHFLRNSNTGGNFSNTMWNFELKLHLKRSENGETTFQNVENTVVFYCIFYGFLSSDMCDYERYVYCIGLSTRY